MKFILAHSILGGWVIVIIEIIGEFDVYNRLVNIIEVLFFDKYAHTSNKRF
jgi:hypothetical protein